VLAVTKSDLLEIHGIGEHAADKLVADGVTTVAELKRVLQEIEPPAGHIYSSYQLAVLSALELPTVGERTVAQYTRRTVSDDEIVYEWETESETIVLELQREGDAFRSKWHTDTGEILRSERHDQRSSAVDALTRCAYRPPESA
jgi:hypothetical protein